MMATASVGALTHWAQVSGSTYFPRSQDQTSHVVHYHLSVFVEIELTNGMVGYGTSIGGPPACFIIEKHLARFVEGQDPRNVELIWDQMWRATVNYGRKGLTIQVRSL